MQKAICLFSVFCAVLLSAGCHKTSIPEDGPAMKTVYDEHTYAGGHASLSDAFSDQSGPNARLRSARRDLTPPPGGDAGLGGYTRTAENEIRALFPVLKNPLIVIYVFPHLTAAGLPVPGYSTTIRMYEKDMYGLPGEEAFMK